MIHVGTSLGIVSARDPALAIEVAELVEEHFRLEVLSRITPGRGAGTSA